MFTQIDHSTYLPFSSIEPTGMDAITSRVMNEVRTLLFENYNRDIQKQSNYSEENAKRIIIIDYVDIKDYKCKVELYEIYFKAYCETIKYGHTKKDLYRHRYDFNNIDKTYFQLRLDNNIISHYDGKECKTTSIHDAYNSTGSMIFWQFLKFYDMGKVTKHRITKYNYKKFTNEDIAKIIYDPYNSFNIEEVLNGEYYIKDKYDREYYVEMEYSQKFLNDLHLNSSSTFRYEITNLHISNNIDLFNIIYKIIKMKIVKNRKYQEYTSKNADARVTLDIFNNLIKPIRDRALDHSFLSLIQENNIITDFEEYTGLIRPLCCLILEYIIQ